MQKSDAQPAADAGNEMSMSKSVTITAAGSVDLLVAAWFAKMGHPILCVDNNEA